MSYNPNTNVTAVIEQTNNMIYIISGTSTASTISIIGPRGVAFNTTDNNLHVAKGNQVNIYNTSFSLINTYFADNLEYDLTYNSTDNTMYICNFNSNNVSVFDCSLSSVTATISVGTNPSRLTYYPNGNKVYVINDGDDTISVIDCGTNTVTSTITFTLGPFEDLVDLICINSLNKIIVTDGSGQNLYEVNATTDTIICSTSTFPSSARGIVYDSLRGYTYVLDNSMARLNQYI